MKENRKEQTSGFIVKKNCSDSFRVKLYQKRIEMSFCVFVFFDHKIDLNVNESKKADTLTNFEIYFCVAICHNLNNEHRRRRFRDRFGTMPMKCRRSAGLQDGNGYTKYQEEIKNETETF